MPIGWPHAVANVSNGLKLAYDGLLPGDLANTVYNYQEVIGKYFKHVQNTDYVGVIKLMHNLMGQMTIETKKTVWNERLKPTTTQSGQQSMIPSTSTAHMDQGPSTS